MNECYIIGSSTWYYEMDYSQQHLIATCLYWVPFGTGQTLCKHVNRASCKWPNHTSGMLWLAQARSAMAGCAHSHFGLGFAMSNVAKNVELGLQHNLNTTSLHYTLYYVLLSWGGKWGEQGLFVACTFVKLHLLRQGHFIPVQWPLSPSPCPACKCSTRGPGSL